MSDNTLQHWLTHGNDTANVATSNNFMVNTVSMAGAPIGAYSFTADDIAALGIE